MLSCVVLLITPDPSCHLVTCTDFVILSYTLFSSCHGSCHLVKCTLVILSRARILSSCPLVTDLVILSCALLSSCHVHSFHLVTCTRSAVCSKVRLSPVTSFISKVNRRLISYLIPPHCVKAVYTRVSFCCFVTPLAEYNPTRFTRFSLNLRVP